MLNLTAKAYLALSDTLSKFLLHPVKNHDKILTVSSYLGDALAHLSFPLLLFSAGQLHPLTLLGPITNYIFLRFIGGDKENEENQEKRYAKENPAKYKQLQQYKKTKNSFWPSLAEFGNKWLWAVAAVGASGVVLERSLGSFLRS